MLTTTVSLAEAAGLIANCGTTNTFVFEGEPGIGKSAMLPIVKEMMSTKEIEYVHRYIDCALLDLGDLQMPRVNDECVHFVPNAWFTSEKDKDGNDKPLVIMLDEIGKANRTVQNALLTLLLEHRIGEHYLPEGSAVFATTNLTTDGVGDMMQAHAKNRVTFMGVRKPTADEWIEWAVNHDIDPLIAAWVKEYPHSMASYTELTSEQARSNPYIFDPRQQQTAFVTPRSLAHASHIVKKRSHMTDDVLISALSGTIGESAARDMQAYLDVADKLPTWQAIVSKPAETEVPESPVAAVVLALGAVMRIDDKSTKSWVTYMRRLPQEVQFLFVSNAMRTPKAAHLAKCREFTDWALENSWAI